MLLSPFHGSAQVIVFILQPLQPNELLRTLQAHLNTFCPIGKVQCVALPDILQFAVCLQLFVRLGLDLRKHGVA